MNLIIITNNPSRASYRQRVGIYLDLFRSSGINSQVVHYPKSISARWKILKSCNDFDAVLLHKKTLNIFDAFWLKRYAQKVIFNFDDAIMYYEEHPGRKPSRRKHQKPFERTIKLANMVIAGNSYLAERAKQFSSNVQILPTGLETKLYKTYLGTKKDDKIRLVWIGSQSTLKYLAQLKPVLEEIGSRFNNVKLRIIADDFFDLQKMQVEKCQWSLQSQIRDLAECNVGLAPLPDNRFTRGKCGFKILQYFAVGLPVVASPVGVNGIYIHDNVNGFLADSHDVWIDKISRLVSDVQLRNEMSQAGIQAVKDFDNEQIGRRLRDLVKKCVEGETK
jgi:glycosyltransferase involved in cell wall biosynthesis